MENNFRHMDKSVIGKVLYTIPYKYVQNNRILTAE